MKTQPDYWGRISKARWSRRRAIGVLAGAGTGAVVMSTVGCDGGNRKNDTASTNTGLVTAPVDTSARAKPGGILTLAEAEVLTLDNMPAPNAAGTSSAVSHLYSRLLKFKTGVVSPPTAEIEGDLAESWEISPDKLQVTFKLRPDLKLDSRAPTNGRPLDAKDVMYSADRFKNLSVNAGTLFRDKGPVGAISSISSPDPRTVIVKLANPDSLTLQGIASPRYLYIYPVEADGGFDARTDARGSGPFTLKSFRGSDGIEYAKNPDWYRKGYPYLDGVKLRFLTEYATIQAQFRAGNLGTAAVRNEDIVSVKKDLPSTQLVKGEFPRSATRMLFGTIDPNSPFKDERVRQAVSMSMDRDFIIDIFDNVQNLKNEGIPLTSRWHTSVAAGWDGDWLDPKGSDFGPNATYYKFNVPEAKRLLAAAGYASGFEFDFHYTPTQYGADYLKLYNILSVLQEVGIKAKQLPEDYNSVFLPGNRSKGQYTGARLQAASAQGSALEMVAVYYHSQGTFGVDAPTFTPEPDVDAMVEKMRQEFDSKALRSMIHDLQRLLAKRMRNVFHPGGSESLSMAQGWLGNYSSHRAFNSLGNGTEQRPYLWFDASKKT